jgi:hypothetical protein
MDTLYGWNNPIVPDDATETRCANKQEKDQDNLLTKLKRCDLIGHVNVYAID